MQQHEWAESAATPPPSWPCLPPHPVHPSRPSQSSLCYTARSHWLCVLHLLVYMSGKAMAPHSSTLAWSIPWTEEPGGLRSMGSLGVRHDWATSLFTFMPWRRKWQPTPVFLPGESQGRGSLVGCRLWGRTGSHRVGQDWSDLATVYKCQYSSLRSSHPPSSAVPTSPSPTDVMFFLINTFLKLYHN